MKKKTVRTIWLGVVSLVLLATASCRAAPVPSVIGAVEIPAGEGPFRVAVNPVTGATYVLNSNNSVSILGGTHLSSTITLTQNAPGLYGPIVAQPRTGRVYVFDSPGHLIRVMEQDGTFTTLSDPSFRFVSERQGAIANPATGYVYAINLWDRKVNGQAVGGSVLVITGTQIVARVPVGQFPSAIAVSSTNGWVYVGDYPKNPDGYKQLMTVISGTQVIATSDMGQNPAVGGGVTAIAVDPRTGQVFTYMNQRLFALRDLKPIRERQLDKPAMQILFNPVNGWLYAMMVKDEVLALDANLNVVGSITIQSERPNSGNSAMGIDPVRGYVYVGRVEDNTLAVIRDTKVITTLMAGLGTTDIGVNSQTGMVYAVNNVSGDVTVVGFQDSEARTGAQ